MRTVCPADGRQPLLPARADSLAGGGRGTAHTGAAGQRRSSHSGQVGADPPLTSGARRCPSGRGPGGDGRACPGPSHRDLGRIGHRPCCVRPTPWPRPIWFVSRRECASLTRWCARSSSPTCRVADARGFTRVPLCCCWRRMRLRRRWRCTCCPRRPARSLRPPRPCVELRHSDRPRGARRRSPIWNEPSSAGGPSGHTPRAGGGGRGGRHLRRGRAPRAGTARHLLGDRAGAPAPDARWALHAAARFGEAASVFDAGLADTSEDEATACRAADGHVDVGDAGRRSGWETPASWPA